MTFFRADCVQWEKSDDAGPVSEADMAANEILTDRLLSARPDYGLLSEETEDTSDRLSRDRVFIIDPIDGTRAFLKGETGFAVAIAVVERGELAASVVHLPALGDTYRAVRGQGATLNGRPIAPSGQRELEGAQALGASAAYREEHWPGGLPKMDRTFRHALEWRLCLIASGAFDLMVTMRDAFEWDVAAGALIASEAGARITDRDGTAFAFNNPRAKVPGVIVAPPVLHVKLLNARKPT
ncbi:3'(2'),5'-bisphosphate nucleotidase CysQ [Rhodobacteraceae bacterium NNCM2]|nr:3'(2'),5'-bisphosphate nucleotidase CysQ [Coraliihabitans acroporae]